MEQSSLQYPSFVSNQVLTPDSLNDSFKYLDEQERMTRVYLTGEGVVQGLQVAVDTSNPAAATLTVSCGCGVTSEGYLIKMDTTMFNLYANFYFTPSDLYAPFCNATSSGPNQYNKFPIYELYNNTNTSSNPSVPAPGSVTAMNITSDFLKDKQVVLLYDLNNVQPLNCDTESCDGLGITVYASIKVLLIAQSDFTQTTANGCAVNKELFFKAIDLKIRRFNVPWTGICTTSDFYTAYQLSFSNSLMADMQAAFRRLYSVLYPLVDSFYLTDPLADFTSLYGFLASSNFSLWPANAQLMIQYYYDLFVDLIDAYNELLDACLELSTGCCPPDNFPRHLLIGLLQADNQTPPDISWSISAPYYTAFMPSGALTAAANTSTGQIVSLYTRLVKMHTDFAPPVAPNLDINTLLTDLGNAISTGNYGTQRTIAPASTGKGGDASIIPINITPTVTGRAPLSERSIPYYYNRNLSTIPLDLLKSWNYDLTVKGEFRRNLSFWAASYSQDPFVIEPLLYDLDYYDFLRIEGIIGLNWVLVVVYLYIYKILFRLPFNVVVVSLGNCCDADSANSALDTLGFGDLIAVVLSGSVCEPDLNDLMLMINSEVSQLVCQFTTIAGALYLIPKEQRLRGEYLPHHHYIPPPTDFPPKLPIISDSLGTPLSVDYYGYDYEITYLNHFSTSNISYSPPNYSPPGWYQTLISGHSAGTPLSQSEISTIVKGIVHANTTPNWLPSYIGVNACNCVYNMQYLVGLLNLGMPNLTTYISNFDKIYTDLINMCQILLQLAEEADINSAVNTPTLISSALQLEDDKMLLLQLLTLCQDSTIDNLVAEYQTRISQVANAVNFSCFSEQYPGLQHRAGVPMGGTLVLVVNSDNIQLDNESATPTGIVLADFFLNCCVDPCALTIFNP